MRTKLTIIASIWIWLCPAAYITAQDWPQFRGGNASGVSAARQLPTEFGPKSLEWRLEVPFARSSPIVVVDRIYLTAHEGEKLITLAVDRKRGKILWQREIIRDHTHKVHKGNDTASATPVSDGRNVYAFFADLGLVSYDRAGKERWRLKLGPFDNFYGMSSSPVLRGATLIQLCDQRKGSFIVAVDKDTGKIRWRKERPEATLSYTTPIFWDDGEKTELIVSSTGRLDAYALETGERLWWVGKQGGSPIATPVLENGIVFASSNGSDTPQYPTFDEILKFTDKNHDGKLQLEEVKGTPLEDHFGFLDVNNDGAISREEFEALRQGSVGEYYGLVAVRAGGQGDQTADHLIWRYKKSFPWVPSPLLYDGVLYFVKDGGIITSINPSNGEAWKVGRAPDAIGEYRASPVAADGKIYFISVAGRITVVKAGRQWEVVSVSDLGEECEATPAIADGHIYLRTRNAVYSFAPKAR